MQPFRLRQTLSVYNPAAESRRYGVGLPEDMIVQLQLVESTEKRHDRAHSMYYDGVEAYSRSGRRPALSEGEKAEWQWQ